MMVMGHKDNQLFGQSSNNFLKLKMQVSVRSKITEGRQTSTEPLNKQVSNIMIDQISIRIERFDKIHTSCYFSNDSTCQIQLPFPIYLLFTMLKKLGLMSIIKALLYYSFHLGPSGGSIQI